MYLDSLNRGGDREEPTVQPEVELLVRSVEGAWWSRSCWRFLVLGGWNLGVGGKSRRWWNPRLVAGESGALAESWRFGWWLRGK